MTDDKSRTDRHPEQDNGNMESCLRVLKAIDFELAYLALLTSEGLKPLSRWEKSLDSRALELLQQAGLFTRQIPRKVKTGDEVIETVFSRSQACIGLYEKRFAGTLIDKSPETQRFEGFLFGFPCCCIEQYIHSPYSKNNLSEEDQKILFHWACDNCNVTPLLLQAYKKVYETLVD